MSYKCDNCDKVFNNKTHFTNHINKKYSCVKNTPTKIKNNNIDNQNKTQCPYCFKTFSRHDNAKRHISSMCKVKKNNDTIKENNDKLLKEIIEEMRNELETVNNKCIELTEKYMQLEENKHYANKTKIVQNINNGTINNNNNNFIVAFGTEDLNSIITDEHCNKLFERGISAIPLLIKYVHFNKNIIRFHNCYISNARDNHAIIFDGKGWCLTDADEVIRTLVDRKGSYLENKYDDLQEVVTDDLTPILSELAQQQFKRYLKVRDTKDLEKRYKEDVKLLLYNNSGMVASTRKKLIKGT